MYLSKLEIIGFKSFADRTKLEFNQGITAIVGPNGSGKSNITEALRWVLGEQSAKSLRGGKMPDVIFAGTEKRKALNYAEVTAKFDNSDGELTGDYGKEITITRRFYRNGDSEFVINGKKKRLKDIQQLFLNIGLGRDSLSIISQGRIEAVFSAKAEERRAIIEEAAGVAKYKQQKHETEQKLTGVQDNLDRLEDIIYELSGQLVPLKAQRETAIQFKELDAKRAKLALSVLLSQIQQEKLKYEQTKADLAETEDKLKTILVSKDKFTSELTDLKKRREEIEVEQESLQSQIVQLTELKGELTKKLELFDLAQSNQEKAEQAREQRKTELTSQEAELNSRLAENEAQVAELQEAEQAHQQKIQELTQELELFSESPEKQMDKLREVYLTLVNKEAQLSNQLTKNEADAKNIEHQQSEAVKSDQETHDKLAEVSQQLTMSQADLANISAEIEQTLADSQQQEAKSQKLVASLKKAQSEQFLVLDQFNKLKARLNSLENIRDNHSNLYAGVRGVMQAKLSGVIGVVADLLTFDKRYETALEVALGGAAQNIVTEDEQAARAAIRYLQTNKLGRATFLPLTTIKERDFRDYARVSQMKGFIDLASNLVDFESKLQPAISNLLGRTVIVDNQENASTMARALNFTTRIVSLDGTQINPGGSYAGGSRNSRNAGTFVNNEIEELRRSSKKTETELVSKEEAVKTYQAEQKVLTENLQELRSLGENKRLAEKEAELRVQQLSQRKAELKELLALSGNQQDNDQLVKITGENEKLKQDLAEISKQKDQLNQELDLVRENSTAQESLKESKNSALTAEKVEHSKAVSKLSFADSEQQRLSKELLDLQQELENLSLRADSSTDKTTREQYQKQLQDVEEKLKTQAVRQVSLRFAKEDLQAQTEEAEQQNTDLSQKEQELYEQKTRLEVAQEQSEQTLFARQESLSDDYQMSYENALAETELIAEEELPKFTKELRDYERQIRALGPVNLDSIPQYEEVNERYEFLNGQKSDLLEAKELLLKTMNEMDEEVRTRFKETFEAVRDSFKVTFRQMFGGGEANLLLTSDDLLTTGIEIVAQPPGKRLGNLNLMSGGEKALTALALLFAILRVRKMPFVILDEVEAALDEANVKRFGDYMNHFDSSNQFIVVTHRKGTMAAAKVMYGVTMGDSGVSKIVSVRFDEEEKVQTA